MNRYNAGDVQAAIAYLDRLIGKEDLATASPALFYSTGAPERIIALAALNTAYADDSPLARANRTAAEDVSRYI